MINDFDNITPNSDPIPSDEFPILNSGSIQLLDSMGNDFAPDTDARLSTGTNARNEVESKRLIRFLLRHKHTTPFEGCIVKLKVTAPIMVIREWFRHRTFSYNEESGRYKQLEPNYYVPDISRVSKQATTNRQGSGEKFTEEEAKSQIENWINEQSSFEGIYVELCNENGTNMAKELARINMPVSHYSTFVATGNLLNWYRFLILRMAPGAQFEIRQYANAIFEIIKRKFPFCTEAFSDYWLNAVTFSAQEIQALGKMFDIFIENDAGMGGVENPVETVMEHIKNSISIKGREFDEFVAKIKKIPASY